MDLEIFVYNTFLGISSDRRAAKDMCRCGQSQQIFTKRTKCHTIRAFCKVTRQLMRAFHLRVDLVAWLLFRHPVTGAEVDIRSPLPEDLRTALVRVADGAIPPDLSDPLEFLGFYRVAQ